jgi:hypothetical protein
MSQGERHAETIDPVSADDSGVNCCRLDTTVLDG